MSDDIINYYKELYGNNPLRKIMNHEELKVKISRILDIMNQNTNEKNKIWPPSSTARDYNGFSQKTIEQIIRDESLEKELVKYNFLLSVISNNQKTSKLFLHTVSKSILFKKRENILGGVDIRVINILPAWLIILEKLCISKIKELLCNKIKMTQYGFIQGGDCNLAKIMVWYQKNKKGLDKHLLIDIKKAFDSINRFKLREILEGDFIGKDLELITGFIDICDSLEIEILGERIFPTKGGPQGSSIIHILFCYYLDKVIQKVKFKENIKLQAYADDMIIQSNNIDDLNEAYAIINQLLAKFDLIINPDKCELLSSELNDKIVDEISGTIISAKEKVKYLGQFINNSGISEEIIANKLFGSLKNKLSKLQFLTRYTRIRLFKTYMISKVNHLLPLISLNGHLEQSWKCIRKIIYRDILKTQTTPLESLITLGIGYYN